MKQQEVVVLSYPGMQGIELFGALDVLNSANHVLARRGAEAPYRVHVLSLDGGPAPMSGVEVSATGSLRDYRGPIDTLAVPGGPGGIAASEDRELVAAVRSLAGRARRVVSFCTGAFILAAAGLLSGRRVTTHWSQCDLLAKRYPDLRVDTDPIFIYEDGLATSAGVTAGIDLMLALVEEDLGAGVAREVAGRLVLFLRRTGSQAQFSVQLAAQFARRAPIRELQEYIAYYPDANLSLEALAERVQMSPRHLARVFSAQVGLSPGRYVEQVRMEMAKRRLEESDDPVKWVADACGFGSAETLRRAFVQSLGISPAEYRRRFRHHAGLGDLSLVG